MNFDEEAKVLQERLLLEPNNGHLMNDFAIALMETNRYEEALVQFENAVRNSPTVQSLHNLAYFYYAEGKPTGDGYWEINDQEAISILEHVIQKNPRSHFPYTLLGEIYISKGHFDKAIHLLTMASSLEATLENLNNLGVCYYHKSMWSQAADYFKKADSLRNADVEDLHPLLGHGICLAKLGQNEEALKIASTLLSQDEENQDDLDRVEDQIAFIYYLTDLFNNFISIYSKLNLTNYSVEWLPPYFYSLWKLRGDKGVVEAAEHLIQHKETNIQEALDDDEAEWEPGRKLEYINELKQDVDFIRTTVKEIQTGKRPTLIFEPCIETRCYLFGCTRHKNLGFTDG